MHYVHRLIADRCGDDGVHAAFTGQRQCAVLQNFVCAILKSYIQMHDTIRGVCVKYVGDSDLDRGLCSLAPPLIFDLLMNCGDI